MGNAGRGPSSGRRGSVRRVASRRTSRQGTRALGPGVGRRAQGSRRPAASDTQLRTEREEARTAVQEADAWAVQVDLSDSLVARQGSPPSGDKCLLATVTNNGTRALGRVRARFSPDGSTRIGVRHSNYVPRNKLDGFLIPLDTINQPGVLAPGGIMQFGSDVIGAAQLTAPEVIVRWRDPYGQEWQHRHGHVTRIADSSW
jgi:hypothetical protein